MNILLNLFTDEQEYPEITDNIIIDDNTTQIGYHKCREVTVIAKENLHDLSPKNNSLISFLI